MIRGQNEINIAKMQDMIRGQNEISGHGGDIPTDIYLRGYKLWELGLD